MVVFKNDKYKRLNKTTWCRERKAFPPKQNLLTFCWTIVSISLAQVYYFWSRVYKNIRNYIHPHWGRFSHNASAQCKKVQLERFKLQLVNCLISGRGNFNGLFNGNEKTIRLEIRYYKRIFLKNLEVSALLLIFKNNTENKSFSKLLTQTEKNLNWFQGNKEEPDRIQKWTG